MLEQTARLVSVPSLAAEGRGIAESAAQLRELLEAEGIRTELHETGGAPVVYGEGGNPTARRTRSTTTTTCSRPSRWAPGRPTRGPPPGPATTSTAAARQ